jgi:hypothetical protein
MMQPAEPRHRHDRFACTRPVPSVTTTGASLLKREMSPILVIIADVFFHEAFQVPLIQYDHEVEQIPAAASYPASRNTVLPRTSKAGSVGVDPEGLHHIDHFIVELRTAIKDQVSGAESNGNASRNC